MNTKNNQHHQDTIAAIEAAFVSLLNKKELKDISVSELCEEAEISRSTFYEKYMDTTAKWFKEEQKLFAKNKALVDKAIEKASFESNGEDGAPTLKSKALEEISRLETELKKTIYNHSQLIAETMELQQVSDNIISRAKLRKLRPIFDFRQTLLKLMAEDEPSKMAHVVMPLFAPKLDKTFSVKSIDNMLNLRTDDKLKGEKVEKTALDFDFEYEDEILDKKIGANFAKLFYELLDQINKWNKVTLKELNGILEIKFGEEVFANRDYYSFLVHLAGKREYSMAHMLEKQDTLLEEMVIQHMAETDREKFKDMCFNISFGEEQVELTSYLSYKKDEEESEVTAKLKDVEKFTVTDMIFERGMG